MKKLIEESNALIQKFYDVFEKSDYDSKLYNFSKANYHASISSLKSLQITNEIVSAYTTSRKRRNCDILLNIYGLFQTLFVGIDSMYELSIGITKKKWSINLNYNTNLREIKYIRNDVVGHPSHRTYQQSVIGYCDLDIEKTNHRQLIYNVYQVEGDKVNELSHEVDIYESIRNYYEEEHALMQDIFLQLIKEESLDDNRNVVLSKMVERVRDDYKDDCLETILVDNLKEAFIVQYSNKSHNYNRFLWRCNILIDLLKVKNDCPFPDILDCLIKDQINRLIKMAVDYDKSKTKREPYIANITIEYPDILYSFANMIRRQKELRPYLDYLSDPQYPHFSFYLKKIIAKCDDTEVLKLVNWFDSITDCPSLVFTLGKLLKDSIKL